MKRQIIHIGLLFLTLGCNKRTKESFQNSNNKNGTNEYGS